MSVVKSERIQSIEQAYGRPIVALLHDLVHRCTYDDICKQFRISRRTLIYWMEKYEVKGPGRGSRSKTSECKAKVSAKLRGRTRSEEVRTKISKKLSGRTLSESTKKKISKALKTRHREKRGDV